MRKKIAIIHNKFKHLHKLGGGESVALWAIEALKHDYDVTLVGTFPQTFWEDIDKLNERFGTSLKKGEFSIHDIAERWGWMRLLHEYLWVVRMCAIMSEARKLRAQYDVLFSTFNEMDLGGHGIQYIHYPILSTVSLTSWKDWLKYPYRILTPYLLGYRKSRMKQNLTLANSKWTADYVRKCYNIDVDVIYPPVPSILEDVPWHQRKNGFICLGRISPEKRIEDIITIGEMLRSRGHDIHLHIIGPEHNSTYANAIRGMSKVHDWVYLEGAVSRERLTKLLAEHKWGIHGMKEEHFGIAVAEIAQAGCIVFVPNGGGQVEIVNNDSRLVYNHLSEAVDKIDQILSDEKAQLGIRDELHAHARQFSTEHFMEQIRKLVADQINS